VPSRPVPELPSPCQSPLSSRASLPNRRPVHTSLMCSIDVLPMGSRPEKKEERRESLSPSPMRSPRSNATRSATVMAEMRRGCVQIMRQLRPAAHASSSRN
jgi:hypothetical protein